MADTPAETAAESTTAGRPSTEEVEEALKNVIDPELGVNIVDLGLLYGSRWAEDGALVLDMTLTTAACPLQDVIEDQCASNLEPLVDEWRVNWVWMPPWGPERITEDGRDQMRALGFNI
ncbi:metal-sulfur cluster assembly factor [Kocuria sp. M1R5S2]|uniref:metal-sulfur cluster assembly factor n=1 Tax=Kocuria rhizosphaerae TaxID=3376285 RepID=UPI0037B34F90